MHRNEADGTTAFVSHFMNQPFLIDGTSRPPATCRKTLLRPTPGRAVGAGQRCAGSRGARAAAPAYLVHRYYQEQYQIDGGRQDR